MKQSMNSGSISLRLLLWRASHAGMAALALASGIPLSPAQALPTGNQQVGSGTHTATPSGNTLTVTTPGRAVISWGSFNIGRGEAVNFQNGGAVLNYVRSGGGASRLDGALNAINPLVLINNQGITVGSTAVISVPSILLTSGTLTSDGVEKFLTGAAYGNGLNAPLISIVMADGDGPVQVDGSIRSTNGGGIGLVAPSVTIGPSATIVTRGFRTPSTGTDGVNTTVNGVVAEGSLWIGTTGLPASPFTAPPGLPTGFGFVQISGQPSPQSASLALQATYDLERFVVNTKGATVGQFDGLFFSPSFRAADFYVYDGIAAIEEGHRESTNGGSLRRRLTHTDAQGNLVAEERDEASILGLTLPPGAVLLNADGVRVDPASGQILTATLTVQPGPDAVANQDFINQFGSGALKVTIDGGASSVVGSNGAKAAYNPQTGLITWTKTIPGTPTTQMVAIPGGSFTINQGQTNPGFTRPPEAGISQQYVSKEGYYYHGNNGQYAGTSPCPGCRYVNPVTGQVTYWRGHFTTDSNGRPQFSTAGNVPPTHVLYVVGGRTYVTDAANFNPQTTPKNPPTQVVTPPIYQQVTTPGTPTVVQLQQALPLTGQATVPQGSATSNWQRPTPPPLVIQAPVPQPTTAPTPGQVPTMAPALVPQPTTAPTLQPPTAAVPTMAPIKVPQPTTAPTLQPPTAAVPTMAPIKVPQPTTAPKPGQVPTMAPGLVPQPTTAPKPLLTPTMAPGLLPQPTAAPKPTQGPSVTPTLAPTFTPTQGPTSAPQPTPSPTQAPVRQPLLTPTLAPQKVPQPTAAPKPTQGPSVTPTLAPTLTPTQGPTSAPQPTPSPTQAPLRQPLLTPTLAPQKVPQPTAAPKPVPGPVLRPLPVEERVPTSGMRPVPRTDSFSYQIPRGLIEQRIPGAIPEQSRARLFDGRALPPGVEFDPFSQTFEIKSYGKISLPLDVLLLVPTRSGTTGSFTLTIGKP